MKTKLYNKKVIEHKIDLFNQIKKILDTKFNEVPIDASAWLLFKEYFDMYGLRISRAYNSDNKNIYILLSDGHISTDINIDDEFKTAIQTEKQLEDFLYRLESDHSIDNVVMRIHPSDEQYKIGELFVIKKILYTLYNYPWMVSDKYVKPADDILRYFKPIYNTGQFLDVCTSQFIIDVFINKLFEDHKPTITNIIGGRSVTIHMDDLSDDCNEYIFAQYSDNTTGYDNLQFLYDLLVDINNRKMHYIYRSIVESLDLFYYHHANDDESIKIKIEYAKATDNIDLEHPSYNMYGYATFSCICNKGKFKVIFDSRSTYNKPLDFHTRCHDYNSPLLPNRVYRMIFEICETLNVLVNKYSKSFIKN